MKGDFHVRFRERLKLKYFGLLDPYFKFHHIAKGRDRKMQPYLKPHNFQI